MRISIWSRWFKVLDTLIGLIHRPLIVMVDRISSHEIYPIGINVRKLTDCKRLNATNLKYEPNSGLLIIMNMRRKKIQFEQQESRCLFMHIKYRSVTFEFIFFLFFAQNIQNATHTNSERETQPLKHELTFFFGWLPNLIISISSNRIAKHETFYFWIHDLSIVLVFVRAKVSSSHIQSAHILLKYHSITWALRTLWIRPKR